MTTDLVHIIIGVSGYNLDKLEWLQRYIFLLQKVR